MITGVARPGKRHLVLPLAIVLCFSALPAAVAAADCSLPEGELTVDDLPEGSDVAECDAVGRVVGTGEVGVTVPEPGHAVGINALTVDGADLYFTIEVADDGTISYPDEHADGGSSARAASALAAAASPGPCADTDYETLDRKEYGTYEWWQGDGAMPAGMSSGSAKEAFVASLNIMKNTVNNCGYTDTVDASSQFQGFTLREAEISAAGVCTGFDDFSTWDAGTLPTGILAATCGDTLATPGIKNDLLEADVRFNTGRYNFTTDGTLSGCTSKWDVRSVAAHEAGHVFGMDHPVGPLHTNLTMSSELDPCTNKYRNLGAGDVLGMRSIY